MGLITFNIIFALWSFACKETPARQTNHLCLSRWY